MGNIDKMWNTAGFNGRLQEKAGNNAILPGLANCNTRLRVAAANNDILLDTVGNNDRQQVIAGINARLQVLMLD